MRVHCACASYVCVVHVRRACASYVCIVHVRHASCQRGRQKNKCPGKCNLFWAKKVLEILKYSDHFSGTEYAGNSLYILNIFDFRISVK